jgi:hypothetical protein
MSGTGEKSQQDDEGVPLDSSAEVAASLAEGSAPKDESSAELLKRLAAQVCIFRGTDGRSDAEVSVDGHHQIHELRSSSFEFWLITASYRDDNGPPPADAINRAVRVLEARAARLPANEPVWIRVGQRTPGAQGHAWPPSAGTSVGPSDSSTEPIYLDLGDWARTAVEITVGGCRLIARSPVPLRRLLNVFWADFETDYPLILGGLFMAVSGGLRMLPQVQLPALPRMADFAQWGEAVSLDLGWQPGSFLTRYMANRRDACAAALEDSPVGEALRWFLERLCYSHAWTGTASEILHELTLAMEPNTTKSARWPKTPHAFSCLLRRLAPQLRTIGIDATFQRHKKGRLIRLAMIENDRASAETLGADQSGHIGAGGDAAGDSG